MLLLIDKYKIFFNGLHNAFTDLIFFKGKYYLSFRTGNGHMSDDGKLMILSSDDLKNWQVKELYSSKNQDVRDSKLFVFKDKIFCIFPIRFTSLNSPLPTLHSLIIYSTDGENWSKPKICEKEWWGAWRPKIHKDKVYSAFYYYKNIKDERKWNVGFFKSEDGIKYKMISYIYKGKAANETEIEFLTHSNPPFLKGEDGGLIDALQNFVIAIVRRESKSTMLAISKYPYKKWNHLDFGKQLHSPVIKKLNGKIILSAREFIFPLSYSQPEPEPQPQPYNTDSASSNNINEIEPADDVILKIKYEEKIVVYEFDINNLKFQISNLQSPIPTNVLTLEEGINIDSGYSGIEVDEENKNIIYISYYSGTPYESDIFLAKIKVL